MKDRYEEIRGLGGQVLVVSFSPLDRLAAYVCRNPLPFPVVADPVRSAYQAFDLGRVAWWKLLHPRFLVGYLRLRRHSGLSQQAYQGEDVLQLGGDFVLAAGRRLVYAHCSTDPLDRPPLEDLLNAVRQAVGWNRPLAPTA